MSDGLVRQSKPARCVVEFLRFCGLNVYIWHTCKSVASFESAVLVLVPSIAPYMQIILQSTQTGCLKFVYALYLAFTKSSSTVVHMPSVTLLRDCIHSLHFKWSQSNDP